MLYNVEIVSNMTQTLTVKTFLMTPHVSRLPIPIMLTRQMERIQVLTMTLTFQIDTTYKSDTHLIDQMDANRLHNPNNPMTN